MKCKILEIGRSLLGALPGINESFEPKFVVQAEDGKIFTAFESVPDSGAELKEGNIVDVGSRPYCREPLWSN